MKSTLLINSEWDGMVSSALSNTSLQLLLRGLLTTLLLLLITLPATSQNDDSCPLMDLMEDYSTDNSADDDLDWSEELERLAELREQPLNLNTATLEQLEQFPFLSAEQAKGIIINRNLHGAMKSVGELALVEEMDYNTIRLLTPFVCVEAVDKSVNMSLKDILRDGKSEAVARLDIPLYRRAGDETSYYGPPLYQSVKYKFNYRNRIFFGFSGEKDVGEPFGALCNKMGYDYYSAHLLINDMGLLKTLAVGDYSLNFGQGLVINTGFSNDNASNIFSAPFVNGGITKHSSMGESNYLCGIAASLQPAKGWMVSPFYSRRMIDGKLDDSGVMTSISETGLHRTKSEMGRKRSTALHLVGANVRLTLNRLRLGVTGTYYRFSRNYSPSLVGYRAFNINGNDFSNIGMDYGYRLCHFTLLGEVARGKYGMATINKLRYDAGGGWRALLLHRYYSHDYWNLFANAYARGGAVGNENGWLLAGEYMPFYGASIFASVDFIAFPWMKYRISHASNSIESTLRTTLPLGERITVTGDYRLRCRDRDVTGTDGARYIRYQNHRWRARWQYSPTGMLTLRTTGQANIFHINEGGSKRGYAITQSVIFKPRRTALKMESQASLFATDNYDTRIYISESGMLYNGYSPSFYGRGIRMGVNLRYGVNRWLTAMCRLTQTRYFDRDEIGSGEDLIESNRKTDLQMLIQCKF